MSTLKADTIQSTGGGAATLTKQSAAKAWVNFTQISTTTIRSSANISSLTDAGTGQSSPISFTSAMADADYAGSFYQNGITGTARNNFNNDYAGGFGDRVTSSFGTYSYNNSGAIDSAMNDVIIFGDLA